MTVPAPRKPICTAHHVAMVNCPACMERLRAERDAAKERLERSK